MKNKLEYIIAILLILECNTVYISFVPSAGIFSILTATLLLWLCHYNIKGKNNIDTQKFNIFFFIYFIGALILFFGTIPDARINYISKFIILLPSLILYIASRPIQENRFNLLYKISNIIFIESIISIIFYLATTVFSIIPPTGSISLDWGGIKLIPSWYNLYFEPQIFRNSGIFTEAPMHNYCLSLAFLTEIFLRKSRSKIKILILAVAILTTLSTTGQFVLIGTIIIQIITHVKKIKLSFFQRIIIIPLLIGVIISLYHLANYLIELKSTTSSYEIRNEDIQIAIDSWISHPLLGCGYGSNGMGSSNSIFVLLAEGGIFMFMIYFFSFIFIPYKYWIKKTNRNYAYFHLIYFGLFCITIILYSNITLLLLSIPLSSLLKKQTYYKNRDNNA